MGSGRTRLLFGDSGGGNTNLKTSITSQSQSRAANAIKFSTFLQSQYITRYPKTLKFFYGPYLSRDLNRTSILHTKPTERETSWHSL